METRAVLTGKKIDYLRKATEITFTVKGIAEEELSSWNGKALDLTVKPHRERRSLNANAFFHALVKEIADEKTLRGDVTTATELKNDILADYGQRLYIDELIQTIDTTIPPEFMRRNDNLHCAFCYYYDFEGVTYYHYEVCRGTKTYNSWEMAVIIEATCSIARDYGITPKSNEEERWKMCERWVACE